jgi:hypothetical protein
MMIYRLCFAVAAAVVTVAIYFFAIGIADGSVSSFNILLWLVMLVCLGSVLAGGYGLNANGQRRTATALLAVLAVPGILAAIFILALIVFQPRWN